METTEVSRGGRRKLKVAASVILFSTIVFLILFLYFQLKVSETPCDDKPCNNGGTCIEVGESINCLCPFGYSGSKCEDSPCSSEPCFNYGLCTVNGTSYLCSCEDGYNGTQCEVTPCFGDPCLNGGTCTVSGSSYLCSCLPGLTGITCEEDLPFCCNCGMGNDCADNTTCPSGIYELHLTNISEVYCDMEVNNGGWIVIQRRVNGEVDFYRGWNSYKYGFGDLDGEFWLGNELIHEITKEGSYMLRIDLEDFEGEIRYALYSNFSVEDANSEYTLRASVYSGNAGDAMAYQNNMQFSTKDRNNIN